MATSAIPFPVNPSMEALPVSSRIREIYPEDVYPNGDYVQLPFGRTRYWLLGPEDGTKVVLIHGISTPCITFIHLAPYLASKGYRVLVYDLYGKGYSEAPKTAYLTNLFVIQLALLMQYLHWDSAHVAGFSMGGGITAAFAATLPHLLAGKVILMASAGVHDKDEARVEKPSSQSPAVSPVPQYQELIKLQARLLPGYSSGVASCSKDGPIYGLLWAFDKLARTRVEDKDLQVLIIHGTEDPLVRYADALEIKKRVPSAQLVAIEGGGHDIPVREGHWQQVAESIDTFLR